MIPVKAEATRLPRLWMKYQRAHRDEHATVLQHRFDLGDECAGRLDAASLR